MNGAPIPDFKAIVRTTPLEQLPQLRAALVEADSYVLMRIADEAAGRRQEHRAAEAAEWVRTPIAAKVAGLLDLGEGDSAEVKKKKLKAAQQTISHWSRGQAWASRPSRKVLLVNLPVFLRWLKLRGRG